MKKFRVFISNNESVVGKGLVHLWLVLTVAALGSVADMMDFAVRHSEGVINVGGLACFAMLKASALTAIYAFCRRRPILRIMSWILIGAFILLSLLNGGCFLFYGFGISRKLFTIVMETNSTEIMEFMPELADKLLSLLALPWLWIVMVLSAAAWYLLPRVSVKWLVRSTGSLSAVGLIYLAYVLATAGAGRTDHSVLARGVCCVSGYMRDRKAIRDLLTKKQSLSCPESLISSHAAEKIVVVIGESASRQHLSIYGYPLPTTPGLDSISKGLYRFEDAVASSTSTAQNMPRLISFMTDEPDEKEWYEYPSLLQLFHKLGYRTYWLSNQEYSGKWSNLSGILSADADVVRYVGSIDSEDHYLVRYDDVVIPEWRKALASGDSLQLIFLHLMGSHFQYSHRYPVSFRHFSAGDVESRLPRKWLDRRKAGIVAEYDNSILYTDTILGEILEGIRNVDSPAVVVYFSDHGENVYDDRDYRGRDPKFADVPFIIYANEAYHHRNPDIVDDIEKARFNSFSTSELPQMILHLSGSKYHYYDSVRDPLSSHFISRKRFVDDEPYYKDR